MSDIQTTAEKRDERIAQRSQEIEQRIDREHTSIMRLGAEPGDLGGLKFNDMRDVMEFSKLMAVSGSAVPPHLRAQPGKCLAICIRALEVRMSPFAVANWSYEVDQGGEKRIAYESAFYNAVILSRGPLMGRPYFSYSGEGDDRRCHVRFRIKAEREDREFITDTVGKLRPGRNQHGQVRGSPLWDKKPDQQLAYNAIRDVARIYFPDVLAGLYAVDELLDEGARVAGPDRARDVTPSGTASLRERLQKAREVQQEQREGFSQNGALQSEIDKAIEAARETTISETAEDQGRGESGSATDLVQGAARAGDQTQGDDRPPSPSSRRALMFTMQSGSQVTEATGVASEGTAGAQLAEDAGMHAPDSEDGGAARREAEMAAPPIASAPRSAEQNAYDDGIEAAKAGKRRRPPNHLYEPSRSKEALAWLAGFDAGKKA